MPRSTLRRSGPHKVLGVAYNPNHSSTCSGDPLSCVVADAPLCRSRLPTWTRRAGRPFYGQVIPSEIGARAWVERGAAAPYEGKLPLPEWCEGAGTSATTGPDIPLRGPLRGIYHFVKFAPATTSSSCNPATSEPRECHTFGAHLRKPR